MVNFTKNFLFVIGLFVFVGCIYREHILNSTQLTDKTANILILKSIVFQDPNLQTEFENLGDWIRGCLSDTPTRNFFISKTESAIISGSEQIELSEELLDRLDRLNAFYIKNMSVSRSIYDVSNIRKLALTAGSIKKIQTLIKLDQQNESSEIGGLVAIDSERNELNFLPITSDNARIFESLQNLASHPDKATKFLQQIRPALPYLTVRADRTIDVLTDMNQTDTYKKKYLNDFIELFGFYSRHSYVLSPQFKHAAIAENTLPGNYLGSFHVHPKANIPSFEDKIDSLVRKNIVIVPQDNGFDIHYLNLMNTLTEKSEVFRYRE